MSPLRIAALSIVLLALIGAVRSVHAQADRAGIAVGNPTGEKATNL